MNKNTQLQKYSSQSLTKIENRLRITEKLLNSSRLRILLIDDDETLCKLLKEQLEKVNYIADYSLRGEDGLHLVKLKKYSLVILGLRMPGMQGEEVLVHIKKYNPSHPVIILTGNKDYDTYLECKIKGASAFMRKPFDFDELLENIQKYISKREMDLLHKYPITVREYQFYKFNRLEKIIINEYLDQDSEIIINEVIRDSDDIIKKTGVTADELFIYLKEDLALMYKPHDFDELFENIWEYVAKAKGKSLNEQDSAFISTFSQLITSLEPQRKELEKAYGKLEDLSLTELKNLEKGIPLEKRAIWNREENVIWNRLDEILTNEYVDSYYQFKMNDIIRDSDKIVKRAGGTGADLFTYLKEVKELDD